jgi:DNA-damage-inducible protein D
MSKAKKNNKLAIFEDSEIRRVFFDDDWYYVIEDVVKALTDSKDPKGYIKDIRRRDEELSKGWGQIATPLPIDTPGGKQSVNCANAEGLFRIIQSTPSKKAEPFKRWLARVGKERLDEIEQPAKAIERGKMYYQMQGRSTEWIQTRLAGIDTRHTFTDTLKESGIKEGYEYAVLTNELYSSWSGFTAMEYKEHKRLNKKDSLRDNMTPLELASTIFSEATSKEMIEKTGAKGFAETKHAIHIAGNITKEAIQKLEKETGKKVVTHDNYKELNSPEIQKNLVRKSLPESVENKETEKLSNYHKKLKKALNTDEKNKKEEI